MRKCINCKKEYKEFMFTNYNLGLCKACFEKFNESKIQRADLIDKVTHRVTCPKCKRVYGGNITDQKCKTPGCNVWFFWDHLDGMVFARWIDLGKEIWKWG